MAVGEDVRPQVESGVADRWPDLIALKVWIIREDGNYFALAEEFNVAGMGPSAAAALSDMANLVCGYFDSAVAEGLSFEEARRPIPLRERMRFQLRRLVTLPRLWLHQKSVAREGAFILPGWVDGHAHC